MKPGAAVIAALLAWVYLTGAASFPLKWEEPRRALIAQEMIHSGDYVVPRLLGEPYLNKPPLQNWLIVLLAGGDARRVGPWAVRGVTLLALAATALLLWRLGLSSAAAPHPLPAVLFLSTSMVVQYGRSGELDGLFTLWVAAALAAFEIGRRRERPRMQWTLSQAVLGLGVLTKGLSPVFFYPPVLFVAWRRRREVRFSPTSFALGLLALAAIVACWIVPYSARAPAAALGANLGDEVARRVVPASLRALGAHLAAYPVVLLGAAAPWSLLAIGLFSARGRARLRAATADPWVELCLATVAWAAALFAFVPEVLPRYLMPALPAACVLLAASVWPAANDAAAPRWRLLAHPALFAGAAVLLVSMAVVEGGELLAELPAPLRASLLARAALLGVAACAAGAVIARRSPAVGWLLTLGIAYGIGWAGLVEPRTAERNRRYVRAAEALASAIDERRPVVCASTLDRKLSYVLAARLDRPLRERPPQRTHYLVSAASLPPPAGASLVREAEGFSLWRVAVPR
jgi:4-amino-4-deoxy-L-arabinose transferase-like glycosyltransferase